MYKFNILIFTFLLMACEKTSPVEMLSAHTLTREATGYYCLMTVLNHKGPKGQIILTDKKVLWFTSVRDTLSFTLSPEEPKNISAIYVNDMTDANWENPGVDNWIDARKAWYVLSSNHAGGMGAPEAVPFFTKEKAKLFASEHGGIVTDYSLIPEKYILGQ